MPDQYAYQDEEKSDESEYPYSYPISPKTRQKIEYPMFPLTAFQEKVEEFPDNVYADSQPANPLKKNKGNSVIKSTQTFTKEGVMGGAFNINEDFFGNETHTMRKTKHRKRRNAYYNEVEQEDEEGFMEREPKVNRLGVIYEEDEHGRKVRKSMYADSDSEYEDASKVPIHHPDPRSKIFNEHSIMGEFDKDEKGNIILLTNEKGNLVCKNGRKVTEKGYLRDRYGHILYASKNRVRAFNEKELDERGEIPLPYSWDRYNFNAFDVCGNVKTDPVTGSPVKTNQRKGEPLTDRNGYQINNKGFLIDQNGNIVGRSDGEVKLDIHQQTKDGDIPMLYTYDGRRFHIRQVMGDFDRDEDGHIVILNEVDEDSNTILVDKKGRPVNSKGYLVDGPNGNIVNHEGNVLFEKHEISPDGEIPKIMPFTKFNLDEIRGDLEKDETGKIIVIHENEKGEILDNQKRRVNARGYLIDNEGNILDQKGNRVFDCDLIDETGEIPKVFRVGLLRSDSTTSLNRFLDELEKIKHNLGLDENEMDSAFAEEEKLLMETSDIEAPKSKRSSENNSMMGDRPSNYNTANLDNAGKFIRKRESNLDSSLSSDDFDVEDPEFLEAIKERRYRRKIKRKYKKPNKKDIMLANAYGGVPRGAKVDKNPLASSRSSRQKIIPVHRANKYDRSSLMGESALDHRRDRPGTKSSRKTLEADTKINYRPADTNHRMDDSDLGMNTFHDESHLKDKSLGGTLLVDHRNKDTLSQNSDKVRKPRGISKNQIREKRGAKTRKRQRRGKNKELVSVDPSDLDKLYGKDVDDFLNESDWDIDSVNNKSQISFKSVRSYGDKRIRGLESIYLQRLEAGTKKNKRKKRKPRFRALQDRYLNNDEVPRDDEYTSSIFSEDKNKKESYFD